MATYSQMIWNTIWYLRLKFLSPVQIILLNSWPKYQILTKTYFFRKTNWSLALSFQSCSTYNLSTQNDFIPLVLLLKMLKSSLTILSHTSHLIHRKSPVVNLQNISRSKTLLATSPAMTILAQTVIFHNVGYCNNLILPSLFPLSNSPHSCHSNPFK